MNKNTGKPSFSESIDDDLRAHDPKWEAARRAALRAAVKSFAVPLGVWTTFAAFVFTVALGVGVSLNSVSPGISWDQLSALATVLAGTAATFSAIVAAFSVFLYGTAISSIHSARAMAAPALHSIRSIQHEVQPYEYLKKDDSTADFQQQMSDLRDKSKSFGRVLVRLRAEFEMSYHPLSKPDAGRLGLLEPVVFEAGAAWYESYSKFSKAINSPTSVRDSNDAFTLWSRSLDDAGQIVHSADAIDRASANISRSRSFIAFFIGFALALLFSLVMKLMPPLQSAQSSIVNLAAALALVAFFCAVLSHMAFSVARQMVSEQAVAAAYESVQREHFESVDSEYKEQDTEHIKAYATRLSKTSNAFDPSGADEPQKGG